MGVWDSDTPLSPQPKPPKPTTKTRGKAKQTDEDSPGYQQWDVITELNLTSGSFKPSEQNTVIKQVVKAAIHAGFVFALTENAWPEYTSRASFVRTLLKQGAAVVGESAGPIAVRLDGEEGYASCFTDAVGT